jgi:hypothetical protein
MRRSNPVLFQTHRALARALARLVPHYRTKAIALVARAIADGKPGGAADLVPLLTDGEVARAHVRAVSIVRRRDAARYERIIARWMSAAIAAARRGAAALARARSRRSHR